MQLQISNRDGDKEEKLQTTALMKTILNNKNYSMCFKGFCDH